MYLDNVLGEEHDLELGESFVISPSAVDAYSNVRHFLFVSTPFGPFYKELSSALVRAGSRCTRVLLNAGDAVDCGRCDSAPFRESLEVWPVWLRTLVTQQAVTDIVVYGDSSPYAVCALTLARSLNLKTHVLEQGYFRPDWITLEASGVNASSSLPRDPDWYRRRADLVGYSLPEKVGRTTPAAVAHLVRYHVAMYLGAPIFSRYKKPYKTPAFKQALGHARRFVTRPFRLRLDRRAFAKVIAKSSPIYLALLQRPGDSQLWRHSKFETSQSFVEHVVRSFAVHAPQDAQLIVRPHPLDPGLDNHAEIVTRAARGKGIEGRVHYIDHGKLHEVLPKTAGVVCVNSTAGLAAVEFGVPTAVLGKAVYDMPGLTHQHGLDRFWKFAEQPDQALYLAYRQVVMAMTQVNGAYATRRGRAQAIPEIVRRLIAPCPNVLADRLPGDVA